MAAEDGASGEKPRDVAPQDRQKTAPQGDRERAWRRRADALFAQALELAPAEHKTFLDQACAGDRRLRRKVERLLAADLEAGDFLEPVGGVPQPMAGDLPGDGNVDAFTDSSEAAPSPLPVVTRRRHLAPAALAAMAVLLSGFVVSLLWLDWDRRDRDRDHAQLGDTVQPPGFEEGPADRATTLRNQGLALVQQGDLEGSERLLREAVTVLREDLGDGHPRLQESLLDLAAIVEDRGDHRQAESLGLEAVELQRRHLGPRHAGLVAGLYRLGRIRVELGELAAAEGHFLEAMAIGRAALGEEHPQVGRIHSGLASVMLRRGDLEAARRRYQRSLTGLSRALGNRHRDLAAPLVGLARVAMARVDPAAAEPLLRRAREILRASLPWDHWRIAEVESELGACLAAVGRGREAAALLEASAAALTARFGAEDPRAERARSRLEDLLRVSHPMNKSGAGGI